MRIIRYPRIRVIVNERKSNDVVTFKVYGIIDWNETLSYIIYQADITLQCYNDCCSIFIPPLRDENYNIEIKPEVEELNYTANFAEARSLAPIDIEKIVSSMLLKALRSISFRIS